MGAEEVKGFNEIFFSLILVKLHKFPHYHFEVAKLTDILCFKQFHSCSYVY